MKSNQPTNKPTMNERELETEHKLEYFDPPNLWPSTLCLSRSSDAQPEPWGPLCWVLAFFTASYQHLLWTPIHQGFPRVPSAGCGFPYHTSTPTPSDLQLQLAWLLSWLSYIIVQRPLDLWNRMFNRHKAEITVMQFTGHSLPVHQFKSWTKLIAFHIALILLGKVWIQLFSLQLWVNSRTD